MRKSVVFVLSVSWWSLTVSVAQPRITKKIISIVFISLLRGHVCIIIQVYYNVLSWLLINIRGPSPSWAVTFPRQMVSGCIRKLAEHKPAWAFQRVSQQCSSMVPAFRFFPWVSALVSLSDELWPWSVRQINLFLPKFLLDIVFYHCKRNQTKTLSLGYLT